MANTVFCMPSNLLGAIDSSTNSSYEETSSPDS